MIELASTSNDYVLRDIDCNLLFTTLYMVVSRAVLRLSYLPPERSV